MAVAVFDRVIVVQAFHSTFVMIKYEVAIREDSMHPPGLWRLIRSQDLAALEVHLADGLDLDGCHQDLRRGNSCGTLLTHTVLTVQRQRYSMCRAIQPDRLRGSDTIVLE